MTFSKIRSRWLTAITLITVLATVPGCEVLQLESTSADEAVDPNLNYISRQWVDVLDDYGLVAICPPQEDVRVGDMFLFAQEPDNTFTTPGQSTRTMATALRWASLPVLPEVEKEYLSRPAWPETPDTHMKHPGRRLMRIGPDAKISNKDSIFASDIVSTRLRAVHLASFLTATFEGENINPLIPTEAVNLVLGTSWLDGKVAMVTPHGGESYELPVETVIDLMLTREIVEVPVEPAVEETTGPSISALPEETPEAEVTPEPAPEPQKRVKYALKEEYIDNLHFLSDPGSDRVWIQVVTEVLYIRGMDISIQVPEVFEEEEDLEASELEWEEPEAEPELTDPAEEGEEAAAAAAPEPEDEPEDEEEGEEEDDLDPAFGAFVRAQAINDQLAESRIPATFGGYLTFISVTDDSASMRRFWKQGLAIGVRGLLLEVDKTSGEVLDVTVLR